MKTMMFISGQLLAAGSLSPATESVMTLPEAVPVGNGGRRSRRHILLGHLEDIRQTMHLLRTLHHAETVLWSPVMSIAEALTITPAQGEAMSLRRRWVH